MCVQRNCQLKYVYLCNEDRVSITELARLNTFLLGMMSCEPTAEVACGKGTGPAPAERASQASRHLVPELSQSEGVSGAPCHLPTAQIGRYFDG